MAKQTIPMCTAPGLHQEVLRLIPKKRSFTHLDIGCGKGGFIQRLKTAQSSHMGIDGKKPDHYTDFTFIQADLNRELPLHDQTFDLITAIEVVEHIENQAKLAREIKAHLKKKGMAIVTSPNIENIFSRLLFLFTGKPINYLEKNLPDHISPLHQHIWEFHLKKAGLKFRKSFGPLHIPFTSANFPLRGKCFSNNVIYRIWHA